MVRRGEKAVTVAVRRWWKRRAAGGELPIQPDLSDPDEAAVWSLTQVAEGDRRTVIEILRHGRDHP
jgi:hypothetical protein